MKPRKVPTRETWSPTTESQCRLAIHSPTDKPTTPIPKDPKGPWPRISVNIDGGKFGRAIVRYYRPTERDRCIIQAILKTGGLPVRDRFGGAVVEVCLRAAAKVADCSRHVDWMRDQLIKIGHAEIEIYRPNGKLLSWFHIVSQIDMLDDGETARVYFTAGYMHLWAVDRWVHSENLVERIAKLKSPRVRAIIQRNLSHGIDFDETLDAALRGIDAMRVNAVEQRLRRAEVRAAHEDGSLAEFGLTLSMNKNTGVEHLAFERKALDKYGVVQLPPADPNAPMPCFSELDHAG
jgi:hypothetical protein